jgi:hypothetical protein
MPWWRLEQETRETTMEHDDKDAEIQEPRWLGGAIESIRGRGGNELRYEEMGTLAWRITRLREEREALGFLWYPLRAYLEKLGRAAGFGIASILDWFGVKLSIQDAEATPLRNLGRELGMTWPQLRAHLEMEIAASLRMPVPDLGRDICGQDNAEACLEALSRLAWDEGALKKLRSLEAEIENEYDSER